MAADFIVINRSKQHGNASVRIGDILVELRTLIDKEVAVGNHMWDTGDYSILESQFGLAAGAGPNFLSLLGQVQQGLNNADAILSEYAARIAGQ